LEKLHNVKINEITSLMLSKTINSILGYRAKDKIHNLIRQMFLIAFNNRIVETNPTLIIPRPKQYAKFEKKAFSPEQEKKFIELCLVDLNKCEPLLICVLQGIRKGEMLALRPNDFDFKKNTLRIDESYDHNYPDDLETKNQASKRTMPMFELTKQILLKYKDDEPTKRIYEKFNGITLGLWLGKLLKANNLPRMTLHELRHTFITHCHEKNIDELIIQKWVGHAKGSRMTKAIYTHINDETEIKSIALLNKTI
jgi:integrase